MYVCMYVCMHVSMHTCMYTVPDRPVYIHACMYEMYVYPYVYRLRRLLPPLLAVAIPRTCAFVTGASPPFGSPSGKTLDVGPPEVCVPAAGGALTPGGQRWRIVGAENILKSTVPFTVTLYSTETLGR